MVSIAVGRFRFALLSVAFGCPLDSMALKKRVNRVRRDEGRATEFDLLELSLADQLVDCGLADAEGMGDFVNLVGLPLQFSFSLSVIVRRIGNSGTHWRFWV